MQNVSADELLFCLEDQNFAPFVIGVDVPEEGYWGIVPDLMMLTSIAIDRPIRFERKPWKRCQAEVKQGETDALAVFIYTEERAKWSVFPRTDSVLDDRYLYQSDYLIFTYPGSNITWDGKTLLPKSATIQSVPGYVSDQRVQAMGFKPMASLQATNALKLIARQQLDGYILDAVVGKTLLKELALEDSVETIELPFMSHYWYIAFSKQSYAARADDIEAFWTALRTVRITESQNIFKRY